MTAKVTTNAMDLSSAKQTRKKFRLFGVGIGFAVGFSTLGIFMGIFLSLFGYVVAEIARHFLKSQRDLPKAEKAIATTSDEDSATVTTTSVRSTLDQKIAANTAVETPVEREIGMQRVDNPMLESNRLANCADCGEAISWNSKTCPKCGAPNNLIHPMADVLINQYRANSDINFEHSGTIVTGKTKVFSKTSAIWHLISGAIVFFVLYVVEIMDNVQSAARTGTQVEGLGGPLWLWITVAIFIYYAFAHGAHEEKKFTINFATMPPEWESNDDDFWHDIKKRYAANSST